MRDCPQCGAFVDGLTCPKCKYSEAPEVAGKKGAVVAADPRHFDCWHVDRGQRCSKLGVFSPNVYGGGPWFCNAHSDAGPPAERFQPSLAQLRQLREIVRGRQPGEDDE